MRMVRWFTRHHHLVQCSSFVQSLFCMVSNLENRSLPTNCLASWNFLVSESTSKSNKTFSFSHSSSILLSRALNMRTSVSSLQTSWQTQLTDRCQCTSFHAFTRPPSHARGCLLTLYNSVVLSCLRASYWQLVVIPDKMWPSAGCKRQPAPIFYVGQWFLLGLWASPESGVMMEFLVIKFVC